MRAYGGFFLIFSIDKIAKMWYKTGKFNKGGLVNHKIWLMFALLILGACHSDMLGGSADDDLMADATSVDVDFDASVGLTDEEIMLGYEAEVASYPDMVVEWTPWMTNDQDGHGKEWWSKAYINGRHDHEVHVYVRYENEIYYQDPPWSSEAEHFALLEHLAELQYPGWNFTFSEFVEGMDPNDLSGEHDVVAILGHHGYSYAEGHEIYLVFEAIFAHEFGHTLGLHHHYCGSGNEPGDQSCPEAYPPGEGPCIMNRNSVSFGPTENTFLLLTTGERPDVEINALLRSINDSYPDGYSVVSLSKPHWDDCGMD